MYNYTTAEGIHVDGVAKRVEEYKESKIGDDLIIDKNNRTLKGEDFMKILTFQLQNQNPMEPMDSSEMLGQISSLNSLRLSESLDLFTRNQNNSLGQGFLGKNVEIETLDETGKAKIIQGPVSAITNLGNESCKIMVNGKYYKPKDVVKVNSHGVSNDATNFLGKHVVLNNGNNAVEGTVTAVVAPNTNDCKLIVNEQQYSPNQILEIRMQT